LEESFYHEYAAAEDEHWWFEGRRAIIRELLGKWLPPSPGDRRKILDVGCGPGGMLDLLMEFGQVHALDPSVDAINYCRERVGDRVTLHLGGVPEGVPRGMSFDVITAFDVIEHLQDPVSGLRGLRSVLKSDGALVCTVPAFKFLWSIHDDINHHFRRYTREMLEREFHDAGFRVKYMSYFNSVLFPPIAAARLIGRLLPAAKEAKSDLFVPPQSVNRILTSVFSAEKYVLRNGSLPFGVSLIAIAVPA
jgi:SAM-dependent methyltransferase